MNKFTTPCFVRVEDAEQRKKLIGWLEGIKRYPHPNMYSPNFNYFLAHTGCGHYSIEPNDDEQQKNALIAHNYIDCSDNIPLFKALAAMRDDNDREQWFITNKGKWVLSKYSKKRCNSKYAGKWVQTSRKATA